MEVYHGPFAHVSVLLPPTRSRKARSVVWRPVPADSPDPCDGVMEVAADHDVSYYAVSEGIVAPGYGLGRAFQVVKAGRDAGTYWCFLAADRPASTCDCAGFSYETSARADRRHGSRSPTLGCVHLDALAGVVDAGLLPDPRSLPWHDVGDTEVTDQPEPGE